VDKEGKPIEGKSVSTSCKSKARGAGVCAPASPPKPDDGPKKGAGANIDLSDILKQSELSSDTKVPNTLFGSGKDSNPKSTVLKAEGALKTFTTVGKDALVALGVAGDLVGAAFVILDFVDHNWVGGAIGLVGVVAGAAAAAAVSGPVGWVVGGLIAAFFASKPSSHSQ
jgi:hypothetical protein